MSHTTPHTLQRAAFPLLAAMFCFLFSGSALADRVQWKSTNIPEKGGAWTVDLTVYVDKTPSMAHVPWRFSFRQVIYFEQSLVDGQEGPVLTKRQMSGQEPIVESVDVGFMDPGTGKIQNRTRFSFKITRDHGFEAGEYEVTVTDGRSGKKIVTNARLVFDGKNEVIDRRAMVFTGSKKDDEKKPEKKYVVQEGDPDDPAYWEGGPTEPEKGDEALPPPEPVKGACGCRVPGGNGGAPVLPLSLVTLFAALALRRRV